MPKQKRKERSDKGKPRPHATMSYKMTNSPLCPPNASSSMSGMTKKQINKIMFGK